MIHFHNHVSLFVSASVLVVLVLLPPAHSASSSSSSNNNSYLNVYGNALESCSQSSMALTGYTRSGSCVEYQDDKGSHHICIDLSSTTDNGGNFCTVTGQSDWCSSYMPCDTSSNTDDNKNDNANGDQTCPVQNWCVCQWAFTSYIEKAGGCDNVQDIQCDAINMEALLAYSNLAGGYKDYNGKYTNALNCIESRCGVSSANLSMISSRSQRAGGLSNQVAPAIILASVACFIFIITSKKVNYLFRLVLS